MRRITLLAALALAAACASPAGSKADGGDADSGYTGPIYSYYKDVKPIVDEHCTGCHTAGGIGPFDLTTFDGVKAQGKLIEPNVQAKVMPPWMPSDDTPLMVGDRRLTDDQITIIVDWVKQGMPAGNPADAPMEPGNMSTFQADSTLQVAQAYTPDTSLGTDDYHCFVLDPALTTDKAVTGFNIAPGTRTIVHHVLLFAVNTAHQTALSTQVATGNGNGYTCFGSSGVDGATLIAGWVPGSDATIFPKGTGIVVSAGSKLVMQVHYNLLNAPDPKAPPTDQTTAQLQYATASSVTHSSLTPIVNNTFNIPVGQVQTVTYALDTSSYGSPGTPIYLYGVTPHMHLHGTDIQVVVHRKTSGKDSLLVHVPKWQFQWQEMYFFQQYTQIAVGDTVTLSCTFDNTQAHQPYINGVQQTAQPLQWGEDTLSEMCLTYVYASLTPPK